jgi:iron complex outermembrane receptor protein
MRFLFSTGSAASLLAALLSSTSAFAQSAPAASKSDSVQSSKFEEIIVTARRRAESISDVPVTVVALSAAALETRGIRTEADLQVQIPGLVVRSANNNNSVNYVMRGESVDAYSGSPPGVQPYVNEVPFPIMTSTAFYDLESVQAVKGPQGTLFGRNSTGGAVLFQTQGPKDGFGGYASVQYGNLITEAALNVPVSDAVRVRAAGTVTSGGAFVRNLYDNKLLGDNQERSGRLTVDLKPSENFTNVTMVQISHATGTNTPNTMYNAVPCGLPDGFNSCIYSPTNQPFFNNLLNGSVFPGYPSGNVYTGGFQNLPAYLRSQGKRVISANAPFTHAAHNDTVINKTTFDFSPDLSLKNIFGYSFARNAINYDTDFSPYPIIQQSSPSLALTGAKPPIETSKTHTYSDELQLQGKALDDRLNFIVGAFYIRSRENYLSPLWIGAINFAVAYNATTGNESYAGFGQATYKVTDALNLTVGGRYTREKITLRQGSQSIFGPAFQSAVQKNPSWTVSLDYHFNKEVMVYATTRGSWRRGGFNPFNPPTATPTTAATGGGGNYFLPEKIRDVEAGVKFDGWLGELPTQANVAFYNSWVTNIQKTAYTVIGGTVSSATINVPKAEIKGIEADVNVRPADWLRMGATMAYTHARFTQPRSLLYGQAVTYGPFGDVPKFSGSIYADASLALPEKTGTLNYHVDVYRQSSFYFSNLGGTIQPGTQLPPYTLINMRLEWANMFGSSVKTGIFVKNLTDKLYYTGGTAGNQNFSNNSATFGAPRTYGFTVRADF